jgi:hypothetical protein
MKMKNIPGTLDITNRAKRITQPKAQYRAHDSTVAPD